MNSQLSSTNSLRHEELESLIKEKSCIAHKSYIMQTKDKSLEQLKHLSLSLDESPFLRIIELEREIKDVKLELALTRTRKGQSKQQLHQQNVRSHISVPKEKQNKELCLLVRFQKSCHLHIWIEKITQWIFSETLGLQVYNQKNKWKWIDAI